MRALLEKVRGARRDQILIVLLTGILLLVIAVPAGPAEQESGSGEAEATGTVLTTPADEKERLEAQLQELLSQVAGVGEARVMITLRSSGKKIVEKDVEQSSQEEGESADGQFSSGSSAQSSESTVYQRDSQGNEIPYVSEEESPEIAGVLILAQGGGDASVKQEITEAVMALFGVEAHKIKVMRMK